MTLVTLAVVFAYFTHPRNDDEQSGGRFAFIMRYGFWRSTIIVLSAVPIAIVTNAARVSGTGILSRYYGTEIADGEQQQEGDDVDDPTGELVKEAVGWLLDLSARRKRKRLKSTLPTPELTVAATTQSTVADDAAIVGGAPRPALNISNADEPVV
jgi:exosortase/archaeosortase family protein